MSVLRDVLKCDRWTKCRAASAGGFWGRQVNSDRREKVELAWKVEGPAAMLALRGSVPDDKRETVMVLTGAGGATADLQTQQAKMFAGLPVAIVPANDTAGVVGAA